MSENIEARLSADFERLRKEARIRRVLYALRRTIQLRARDVDAPTPDAYIDMTNNSATVIAPYVEALEILESIIYASDGCAGHRECVHSMEPWQRARRLLTGLWEADERERFGQ